MQPLHHLLVLLTGAAAQVPPATTTTSCPNDICTAYFTQPTTQQLCNLTANDGAALNLTGVSSNCTALRAKYSSSTNAGYWNITLLSSTDAAAGFLLDYVGDCWLQLAPALTQIPGSMQ